MIEESTIIPAGLIKRIHIDQHRNAANKKDGGDRPVYTVQALGGPYKAHEIVIHGQSRWVSNANPLSCGAIHYGITHAEVSLELRAERASDLPSLSEVG